ncbi:T9SS type A sorting domain-containing protein [bacterium]|nr:T9SS type A sorting domain-containing protein [bacterium]
MKRPVLALLCVTLLLVAGSGMAHAAKPMSIAIPHQAELQPTFEAVDSTPGRTALRWTGTELNIVENEDGNLQYLVPGTRAVSTEETFPVHGGLVAMPWGVEGELRVHGGTFYRLDDQGNLVEDATMHTAGVYEEDFVEIGSSVVFRDLMVAPVNVHPVLEGVDGSIWVASNLEFDVVPGEAIANAPARRDRPISRAFAPLYDNMLLNDIDDMGVEMAETRGSYLIISANVYLAPFYTNGFIEWKEAKGYNVVVESFDHTQGAISLGDLSDIIENAYNTLDPPLEYVLLVGDENRGGNAAIPATRIGHPNPQYPTENDVTDWPLTFIDGDDYFPEVFIGRFTVGDVQGVVGLTGRSVNYEKNGYDIPIDDPYWRRAALVAANYNEGGGTPLTPIAITDWLSEHMLEDWGFQQTNKLYYEEGGNNATADDITTAINSGVSWVTYRGWGDALGWVHPEYRVADVEALDNYFELPILASFVCNTGDFGNGANANRCFSEVWITAGSANEPTGAVAAIAPSDLHTYTRYNNAMIAGFFWGAYEDDLHSLSQILLRAKQEIYLGFPNNRGYGDYVEFYYHVYHILGDPELDVWKHRPRQFDITMPTEVALGQGHVDFVVNGQWGPHGTAHVQLKQGDNLSVGRFTNANGMLSLPISDAVEGAIEVTITAPNYIPYETTINVAQEANSVGLQEWSVDAGADGLVTRREDIDLTVTLWNGGTQSASDVTATLTFPDDELVTIMDGESSFGTISSGGTADNAGDPFSFRLEDYVYENMLLEFNVEIASGSDTWQGKLWVETGHEVLRYVGYENVGGNGFEPGETASLRFKFANHGSVAAQNIDATLSSFDESITGISGNATGLTFGIGEEVWIGPFDVTVSDDTWRGRPVSLRMSFADGADSYGTVYFTVPLEGAQTTDPFGPDGYGYYAYDNTDTSWPNAPTYTWFNLDEDPQVTEHFEMIDDDIEYINLPFDVQYYGEVYPAGSTLTISSNGWVSFFEEKEYTVNFFRNWQLPTPIGPHAMIAPFWDDIGPFQVNTMNVYYKFDDDNDRIIIEWTDAASRRFPNNEFPAHFALVIYSPDAMQTQTGDSVIEVHYEDVENIDDTGNFCTVGLMKPDRTTGLQYTYASLYPAAAAPLEAGRAIRFTTMPPDNLSELGDAAGDASMPDDFVLYPVQPNPFNSSTVISFDLPESGEVQLSIYNLLGQELVRLVDRPMTAGHKEVVWQVNDRSISSGMLLIRLNANNHEQWGKMMYLK